MQLAASKSPFQTEQREVSLLFADLRGSTEIAGALQTDPLVCELLGHVMDCLSDAVAEQDGFIVDYFGDGMMAMWNAPAQQADHADRACEAALQILAALPRVSEEWSSALNSQLRVGIGVHTGCALVGNAGSSRKEKYGPRGPNVNLASRVEAATKELGIPFVVTRATADLLSDRYTANRACRAQMPGLSQAIDLFSVRRTGINPIATYSWQAYARALHQFESGDFNAAAETLAALDRNVQDIPRQFLMQRVQNEQARSRRRRSTDQSTCDANGVMIIAAT